MQEWQTNLDDLDVLLPVYARQAPRAPMSTALFGIECATYDLMT